MIDINLIRTNKEIVKENIRKKFQDAKLPLVDEVEQLDIKLRALKQEGDTLRASRNTLSAQIGALMKEIRCQMIGFRPLRIGTWRLHWILLHIPSPFRRGASLRGCSL